MKLLLAQAVMCELDNRFGEQQRAVYVAAASLATGTSTGQSLQPLVQAAVDAGLHVDCKMLLHEIPIALRILSAEQSSQEAPVTSVPD